jgi:hypothetical protein
MDDNPKSNRVNILAFEHFIYRLLFVEVMLRMLGVVTGHELIGYPKGSCQHILTGLGLVAGSQLRMTLLLWQAQ